MILANYTIIDKNLTYIHNTAIIGEGVIIYPFVTILENVTIGKGSVIFPHTTMKNCEIGENCEIKASNIEDSKTGNNCTIGPFAYLRSHAELCDNVKIGDFVEVKNSIVKNRTKSAHLSYIGDAEVGEDCNIGCGVIFANYDGKKKHKTKVGNRVFLGSNCNLVAPINVGDGSYICAGTTITEDVSVDDLVVGRVRPYVKKENGKGRYK